MALGSGFPYKERELGGYASSEIGTDEHQESMFTPQKGNSHHLAVEGCRHALAGVPIDAHDGFGGNPVANL